MILKDYETLKSSKILFVSRCWTMKQHVLESENGRRKVMKKNIYQLPQPQVGFRKTIIDGIKDNIFGSSCDKYHATMLRHKKNHDEKQIRRRVHNSCAPNNCTQLMCTRLYIGNPNLSSTRSTTNDAIFAAMAVVRGK